MAFNQPVKLFSMKLHAIDAGRFIYLIVFIYLAPQVKDASKTMMRCAFMIAVTVSFNSCINEVHLFKTAICRTFSHLS